MKKFKDKVEKYKVKRRKVDWVQVLYDLNDFDMLSDYYILVKTGISLNRCAYIAIRKHSTTATMHDLRFKYGV